MRYARLLYWVFLRLGQEGLNDVWDGGNSRFIQAVSSRGIIQCHLHPAIPRQVAPQQSNGVKSTLDALSKKADD